MGNEGVIYEKKRRHKPLINQWSVSQSVSQKSGLMPYPTECPELYLSNSLSLYLSLCTKMPRRSVGICGCDANAR